LSREIFAPFKYIQNYTYAWLVELVSMATLRRVRHFLSSFVFTHSDGLAEFTFSGRDSSLVGQPVLSITNIHAGGMKAAELSGFLLNLKETIDDAGDRMLISARLDSNKEAEINLLQEIGFRFMELSLHPELNGLQSQELPPTGLEIVTGNGINLDELIEIAESSFQVSRFHRDPFVPKGFADKRFGHWVRDAAESDQRTILQIQNVSGAILGFFVTRMDAATHSYWELTALSPRFQGKSLGKAAWNAVLKREQQLGVDTVRTTISAENLRVVGLYPRLGFRFSGSSVVLHNSF
jgi:ribosomal protein S18 acetylase RimI-like enzyme